MGQVLIDIAAQQMMPKLKDCSKCPGAVVDDEGNIRMEHDDCYRAVVKASIASPDRGQLVTPKAKCSQCSRAKRAGSKK